MATKHHLFRLFLGTLLVCSIPPFARAQSNVEAEIEEVDDETCMECHGDEDIEAETDRGKNLDLHVDADALSEALGLPSNGAAPRRARRDKGRMADAFRDAGLRVPRQHCSSQLELLIEWARSEALWPLVVKPSNSSSSDGVQLCRSQSDVKSAFEAILGQENVLGLVNREVVAQEYLSGPAYVVDTVSCGGRHRLVALWRYQKPPATESFIGYDAMELINSQTEEYLSGLLDLCKCLTREREHHVRVHATKTP